MIICSSDVFFSIGVLCVYVGWWWFVGVCGFFFQAEDGIRDLVRSRGLGDVYKRQDAAGAHHLRGAERGRGEPVVAVGGRAGVAEPHALSLIHI